LEIFEDAIIVLLSVGNADSDGTDGHASGRKAEGFMIAAALQRERADTLAERGLLCICFAGSRHWSSSKLYPFVLVCLPVLFVFHVAPLVSCFLVSLMLDG